MWSSLGLRRQMIVAGATALVFLAILFLSRGGGIGPTALLYTGLDDRASGEVVAALEARGAAYEVHGNAIYVSSSERDRLRLALATEGLPATGGQGYELLDNLSGFGTTSQMFDAAYWRAKEGELARTIESSPHIRSARVHISTGANRPFERNASPTAAVTISTLGGATSTRQARALRHLVAASVSGLTPQSVSIIDDVNGLMTDDQSTIGAEGDSEAANAMRTKVERLLSPYVGTGNAVVEVSVERVTEEQSIIERMIDPQTRVPISMEREERTDSSDDSGSGAVTVASNLPEGDTGGEASTRASKSSSTREITNYELSQTERQIVRHAGDIRRLTVAVLLNQPAPDATRSEEELTALRGLVASAVGLQPDRGDMLTLEEMPFANQPTLGTEALAGSGFMDRLDLNTAIQLLVLGLVAIVLALFVIRPILTNGSAPAISLDTSGAGASEGAPALAAPDGSSGDPSEGFAGPMGDMGFDFGTADSFMGVDGGSDDDEFADLKSKIANRPDETLQLLQAWVDAPETERPAT